jgi:hypothetical protein
MSGACLLAGSLSLAGCAVFDPQSAARSSARQSMRVALKDDAWTARAVAPARPKVASNYRSAAPPPSPTVATIAPANESGSCGSADQCALLLRIMVDDPERSWINERPSVATYSNGTRLFAYLALRTKLSCRQLATALDETRAARSSLSQSVPALTLEHLSRVRTLNAQVEGELRAEQTERCKSGVAEPSG